MSASLSHVPAAFSITCNNDTRSFQCLDQTGGDLWEQGSSHAPKHANNDERETSSSQAGNVEDAEAYRRWYGEHHHGEFGLRKVRTVTSSRSGLMSLTTARTASVVMVRLARLKKPQRPGVLSRI